MREYYNYENLTDVPYYLYQRSFILDPSSLEQSIKQESKPVGKFWRIRKGLSKFRDISIITVVEQPVWYK